MPEEAFLQEFDAGILMGGAIASQVECPVLVMHGTDDDIVPIESGMAIQEALHTVWSAKCTPCSGCSGVVQVRYL